MNRREITYYDVSPFAAVSAKAAASDNLQAFSSPQKLFDESIKFRNIQTCEQNYTVLDGTHDAFAPNEDIALWTAQQSLPSGQLQTPVTLDITFGGLQTSSGISFDFDTQNNVYAGTVRVQWYRDATLLFDITFNPARPTCSVTKNISLYNRVYITFTRLNMPYRYLKIEAVYFGLIRVFGDGELESLTVNEGCDPTNGSIYINSASFAFNTHDPLPYFFMTRQPLKITYNGVQIGRYYIDKSTRRANRRHEVEAIDRIGVLDNTDEFLGGIYNGVPASSVIDEIINGLFHVALDASLKEVRLTGWIPVSKRRDALAQVALAIGAVVDATRDDNIKIKPLPKTLSGVIPANRVYRSSTVNIEFPYTGVEVVEHNYVLGGDQKDLFKDTFMGTKTVKFSEPAYNLVITNGKIADAGANYAVITSDGTAETSLKGNAYIDSQNSVVIKTADLIEGTQERVQKIDKGYLVNKNNSQAIAQRLYEYYTRREVFDGEFIAAHPFTEKIGDVVRIATAFDEGDITGQIEKLTLNLGYANIKARGVIRGN